MYRFFLLQTAEATFVVEQTAADKVIIHICCQSLLILLPIDTNIFYIMSMNPHNSTVESS